MYCINTLLLLHSSCTIVQYCGYEQLDLVYMWRYSWMQIRAASVYEKESTLCMCGLIAYKSGTAQRCHERKLTGSDAACVLCVCSNASFFDWRGPRPFGPYSCWLCCFPPLLKRQDRKLNRSQNPQERRHPTCTLTWVTVGMSQVTWLVCQCT